MGEIRKYTIHMIDGMGGFTPATPSFLEEKDSWYWHVGDHCNYGEFKDDNPQEDVVCVAIGRTTDSLESVIPEENLPSVEAREKRMYSNRIDVFLLPKNVAISQGVELNDMGF